MLIPSTAVLTLLPLLTPPGIVRDLASFEEVRAELEEQLVEDLEEVASWCQRNRAFAQRDVTYEKILELRPDHRKARQFLQYKERNGEWERRPYTRPDDRNEEVRDEAIAQRDAALTAYGDAVIAAIDSGEHELTLRQVNAAVEAVLALAPGHAGSRERMGEVFGTERERWVLVETLRGQEERARLADLSREVFRDLPDPTPSKLSEGEAAIDVDFSTVLQTDLVRVLCATEETEAVSVAELVHATLGYWRGALGVEGDLPPNYRVYILEEWQRDPYIDSYPNLTDEAMERLRRLTSSIMAWYEVASWAATLEARRDAFARIEILQLFKTRWPKASEQAWVVESLGLYLSYPLVRTRMTFFIDVGNEGSDSGVERSGRNANWMRLAGEYMHGERPPVLAFLLGKSLGAMTMRDAIVGYAFAAYLVEGHPGALPQILDGVETGKSIGEMVESVLGRDLKSVQGRFARWLREHDGI